MSASLSLYRLQLVDSRIDEIRMRLEEIQRILEDSAELRQAKEQVAKTETAHKSALQVLKQAEAEVDNQKAKIEQSEASLYSGNVKNPKELQDLQNEAASLKRYLETLEERQLEAMLEEEATEETNQLALREFENVRARLAEQNVTLTTEQAELNKELERLGAERQAALDPIDTNLLTDYDELRQQRRGVAVTQISEGACAACGTTLTPSQNQSARSATQIFKCPTCGRILFAN
jgi:predicted  nucleic acid-binding Zn-ribbon protein